MGCEGGGGLVSLLQIRGRGVSCREEGEIGEERVDN